MCDFLINIPRAQYVSMQQEIMSIQQNNDAQITVKKPKNMAIGGKKCKNYKLFT